MQCILFIKQEIWFAKNKNMLEEEVLCLGSVCLIIFAQVIVERFELPRPVVAWLVLVYWICWNRKRNKDWIHLWVLYGFAFWSAQLAREDGTALLVITTLMQAALIVAGYFVPEPLLAKSWVKVAISVLLVTPLACNNLFFHPVLAIFRLAVFSAAARFVPHPIGAVYLLFSKAEALLPLIMTHVVVRSVARNYGNVIPDLPIVTQKPPKETKPVRTSYFTTLLHQ